MKVENRKVIAGLSRNILLANGRRNLVAVIAIVLTTVLFTTLFTVGGNIRNSIQQSTMRQVGTQAHGGFKFLTWEQYEAVTGDPKVKDISYNIFVAIAENPELRKSYTEIRYTEEKAAKWGFSMPETGKLPVEKYDLATSTKVLDELGVPHELGQKLTLIFQVGEKSYTQEFTLCGFWDGSVCFGANQAFVSREYCDEVAPLITVPLYESGENSFAGTVNPSLWFSSSWDLEGQMNALKMRLGMDERVNEGVNWAYSTSSVDATTILLLGFILLIILASCYLIIYNIFEISVSGEIRFYGLLKTIGTTEKQLKRLVRRQAFLLSGIGIPIGLLGGYLIGVQLMPVITKGTALENSYEVSASPLIFVGAALFSLLTVRISCIRPCRLAARVSPVEAVRFSGVKTSPKKSAGSRKTHRVTPLWMAVAGLRRNREKFLVVLSSLLLSLILLNGTYTIVSGFDMDKYLQNYVVSDFAIKDVSLLNSWGQEHVLDGIPEETMDRVRALPGLSSVGAVWGTIQTHVIPEVRMERMYGILERNAEALPSPYADEVVAGLKEKREMISFLYGVDPTFWDRLELKDGVKLDAEKFASGEYVLATAFYDTGREPFYEPGEQVEIDFGNGNKKVYTVLALGGIPYALSQQFGFNLDIRFTLPAEEYRKQMGETGAMVLGFNMEQEYLEDAEAWCKEYTEEEMPSLGYTSRFTQAESFQDAQLTFAVVGGVLTFVLALIGVLNFMNVIVTSIDARRNELAVLQSIGMTGKQLRRMLYSEGLVYALITLVLAGTIGQVLCYFLIKLLTAEMWYFDYHFSLLPLLLSAPALVLICLLVPAVCYRMLTKKTVVERLRECEG